MRIWWTVLVTSILILLTLAVNEGDAQTVKPLAKLTVYDANGKKVGEVLAFRGGGSPLVAMKVNGMIATLTVFPDHLEGSGLSAGVHFGDVDCGGQAYIRPDLGNTEVYPMLPLTVMTPALMLWIEEPGATTETATMRSFLTALGHPGDPPGRCGNPSPFNQTVRKAIGPIDLSGKFTPPFTVR